MSRIILAFILLILLIYTPVWFWVLGAILYALYFDAYELICFGVLIDAFYGTSDFTPYITLILSSIVICALWIRPRLLYTT